MSNPRTFAATSGGRTPRTDAGVGGNGPAPEEVASTDYVPRPEAPTDSDDIATEQTTSLTGASFYLERPVEFNRVSVYVNATPFTAPVSMRVLIYQATDGVVANASLIASMLDSPPAADQVRALTPAEGTVRLETGVYWLLAGRSSAEGEIALAAYSANGSAHLLNQNLIAGQHPTTFSTTIAASAAPQANFDPFQGGADGVSQDFAGVHVYLHRLWTQ